MSQYRVPILEQYEYQQAVLDKDLTAPPGSPTKGDRYIVGPSATGAWASQDKKIAWYDGAAWVFDAPIAGWQTWVADEVKQYTYNGTNWMALTADMTKAIYDTDNDGIVDKAESVDDGIGNSSTAVQVKDAVTKKHTGGTDQYLDQGGANEISAAHAKEAYDKRGSYDSGLKVILFNM